MYLHHSLIVGMDAYIQHKHDLFMKKEYPKKASNVFDRLDKDKKEREGPENTTENISCDENEAPKMASEEK